MSKYSKYELKASSDSSMLQSQRMEAFLNKHEGTTPRGNPSRSVGGKPLTEHNFNWELKQDNPVSNIFNYAVDIGKRSAARVQEGRNHKVSNLANMAGGHIEQHKLLNHMADHVRAQRQKLINNSLGKDFNGNDVTGNLRQRVSTNTRKKDRNNNYIVNHSIETVKDANGNPVKTKVQSNTTGDTRTDDPNQYKIDGAPSYIANDASGNFDSGRGRLLPGSGTNNLRDTDHINKHILNTSALLQKTEADLRAKAKEHLDNHNHYVKRMNQTLNKMPADYQDQYGQALAKTSKGREKYIGDEDHKHMMNYASQLASIGRGGTSHKYDGKGNLISTDHGKLGDMADSSSFADSYNHLFGKLAGSHKNVKEANRLMTAAGATALNLPLVGRGRMFNKKYSGFDDLMGDSPQKFGEAVTGEKYKNRINSSQVVSESEDSSKDNSNKFAPPKTGADGTVVNNDSTNQEGNGKENRDYASHEHLIDRLMRNDEKQNYNHNTVNQSLSSAEGNPSTPENDAEKLTAKEDSNYHVDINPF